MKLNSRKILSILLVCFCIPHQTQAASVACDRSLKSELWSHTSNNSEVKKLQAFLTTQGHRVPVTGYYGLVTSSAVKSYQSTNGISPTGGVGSITRSHINQRLCSNDIPFFDAREKAVIPAVSGVLLDVPLIEQSYRLSCEAAAMEMVLRYRGITKTQTELMKDIGYATPFVKKFENGKLIWGDPDLGFVGDEKGWVHLPPLGLWNATGWGVNPPPVTRVLKTFLPETFSKEKATVDDIISSLDDDKPVIFWHKRDDMITDTIEYKTPLRKTVSFTSNHVALIVGYEKNNKGERFFWINDPTFGRFLLDEQTLVRFWGRWENKMVVSG